MYPVPWIRLDQLAAPLAWSLVLSPRRALEYMKEAPRSAAGARAVFNNAMRCQTFQTVLTSTSTTIPTTRTSSTAALSFRPPVRPTSSGPSDAGSKSHLRTAFGSAAAHRQRSSRSTSPRKGNYSTASGPINSENSHVHYKSTPRILYTAALGSLPSGGGGADTFMEPVSSIGQALHHEVLGNVKLAESKNIYLDKASADDEELDNEVVLGTGRNKEYRQMQATAHSKQTLSPEKFKASHIPRTTFITSPSPSRSPSPTITEMSESHSTPINRNSKKRRLSSGAEDSPATKRRVRPPYSTEQDDFIRFVRDDLCHSWVVAQKLYNQFWHPGGDGKREIPGLQSRYYRLLNTSVRERKKDSVGRPELGILAKTERRYWWMLGSYDDAERRQRAKEAAAADAARAGIADDDDEEEDEENETESEDAEMQAEGQESRHATALKAALERERQLGPAGSPRSTHHNSGATQLSQDDDDDEELP